MNPAVSTQTCVHCSSFTLFLVKTLEQMIFEDREDMLLGEGAREGD